MAQPERDDLSEDLTYAGGFLTPVVTYSTTRVSRLVPGTVLGRGSGPAWFCQQSTTIGAWSEGSLPLRASRSM
jgi:hypothetical protein